MKTIFEHLATLPEPYRTQAIANCEPICKESIKPSLPEALFSAFTLNESPEGGDYWYKVYEHYKSNGAKPLPKPIPLQASTHTVGSTLFTKSDLSRTPRTVIAQTPDGKLITVPSAVVEVVGVEEVENE